MNGSNDIGDIVSRLTENPEMMKTIMGIAGKLKSDSEKQDQDRWEDNRSSKNEREDEGHRDNIDSDPHRKKGSKGDDAENLIRLLLALKPYVGVDRCDKIDGIVKILKLVQLSEKTGLLRSFL